MKFVRTPDSRFENLDGYDFKANYKMVDDAQGNSMRMHYVDEGPNNGLPILLLHGEPSWSYLYRKMITPLSAAGFRVLAPDLIGFGRSDKPLERSDYTYQRHLDWLSNWLDQMELSKVVLFCQDWGGLLGLRLVAANPSIFEGVVVANTFLPTGESEPSAAFISWRNYSQSVQEFNIARIIAGATVADLSEEVLAAYDAPFPEESYKSGARQFPTLVPIAPDDPQAEENKLAWGVLSKFAKPFLTAFSDKDPVTASADKFFQKIVPGCRDQKHVTIRDGGHFLQEDKGAELAQILIEFVKDNGLNGSAN